MNKYKRMKYGECFQTAELRHLPSGRFAFATSLFGEKPYELNMNMPIFDTNQEAIQWIQAHPQWEICAG